MLDKSVMQNENVQERLRFAFLAVGFFTFAMIRQKGMKGNVSGGDTLTWFHLLDKLPNIFCPVPVDSHM
jgi:hypothetical protein